MFCHKCGVQADSDAVYCQNCGAKLMLPDTGSQVMDKAGHCKDNATRQTESAYGHETSHKEQTPADADKQTSEFKEWWDGYSKIRKIAIVLGGVLAGGFVLYALVAFLRKFGALLMGVFVVASLIFAMFIGSEKERIEARKTFVKMVVGFAIIAVVAIVIVSNPDFFTDIIRPGANVRNAYLSQYSESITVEEAFDGFFDNGKWDTYKEGGYSYVVFTGTREYVGDADDMRITFKITGEHFLVDSLEINGVKQNDFMLALLLAAVYKDY